MRVLNSGSACKLRVRVYGLQACSSVQLLPPRWLGEGLHMCLESG